MLKVIQIQINNMSLVSQSPFIMCNLFSRQRLLSGIEKFLPALHAWHRLHIFPPVCDLFLLMERKCFSETERQRWEQLKWLHGRGGPQQHASDRQTGRFKCQHFITAGLLKKSLDF